MNRFLSGILLSVLCWCCNGKDETPQLINLIDSYEQSINLNEFDVCFIIPLDGCSTCIAAAIEYANNDAEDSNVLVIASSYSYKQIKFKFNSTIRNRENFIADFNDLSHKFGILKSNPLIFILDQGKVVQRHELPKLASLQEVHERISDLLKK